jgi:hypothetical protein
MKSPNKIREIDDGLEFEVSSGNISKWCKCSKQDIDLVKAVKWGLDNKGKYVRGAYQGINQFFHRIVCPTPLSVDHIDRNTLNNRRDNLRPATGRMQNINRVTRSDKELPPGVCKAQGRYIAYYRVDDKSKAESFSIRTLGESVALRKALETRIRFISETKDYSDALINSDAVQKALEARGQHFDPLADMGKHLLDLQEAGVNVWTMLYGGKYVGLVNTSSHIERHRFANGQLCVAVQEILEGVLAKNGNDEDLTECRNAILAEATKLATKYAIPFHLPDWATEEKREEELAKEEAKILEERKKRELVEEERKRIEQEKEERMEMERRMKDRVERERVEEERRRAEKEREDKIEEERAREEVLRQEEIAQKMKGTAEDIRRVEEEIRERMKEEKKKEEERKEEERVRKEKRKKEEEEERKKEEEEMRKREVEMKARRLEREEMRRKEEEETRRKEEEQLKEIERKRKEEKAKEELMLDKQSKEEVEEKMMTEVNMGKVTQLVMKMPSKEGEKMVSRMLGAIERKIEVKKEVKKREYAEDKKVKQWIEEGCEKEKISRVLVKDAYDHYTKWSEEKKMKTEGKTKFLYYANQEGVTKETKPSLVGIRLK